MKGKKEYILLLFILVPLVILLSYSIASALKFTQAPSITKNPNSAVPLACLLFFQVDRKVTTLINCSDGSLCQTVKYSQGKSPENGRRVKHLTKAGKF